MATIREACDEAMALHGEQSLWSDGGTTWRLDLYLDALVEAEADRDDDDDGPAYDERPAHFDGHGAICPVGPDGYISSPALLTAQRCAGCGATPAVVVATGRELCARCGEAASRPIAGGSDGVMYCKSCGWEIAPEGIYLPDPGRLADALPERCSDTACVAGGSDATEPMAAAVTRVVTYVERYGDDYGERAALRRRGGHWYIVRTAEAFSPRAGEKTWHHVASRAAGLGQLTEEYYEVEPGSADWCEEVTR